MTLVMHTVRVDHRTDADYLIGNERPFQNKALDAVMRPDAHVVGAVFIAMDMTFRCELFTRTCTEILAVFGGVS